MEALKQQGWNLTESGFNTISNNGKVTDVRQLSKIALDYDLKDIGVPILADKLNDSNLDKIVLQVHKLRNISAPKANENSQAAPRMLKFVLTDGFTHCQAVELGQISINVDKTAPGTKLLISKASISNGFVLLESQDCSVLGGKVQVLFDKWELARNVATSSQKRLLQCGVDGPPAWVPFGKRIPSINDIKNGEKLTKSLPDATNDNPEEFDSQRKGAIKEASTAGAKKVFGGGTKQAITSQQQVTPQYAAKNVQKPYENRNVRENDSRRGGGRKGRREMKETEEKQQKPSENYSLFDFLAEKIPESKNSDGKVQQDTSYNTTQNSYSNYNQGYNRENNRGSSGRGRSNRANDRNYQPNEKKAQNFNENFPSFNRAKDKNYQDEKSRNNAQNSKNIAGNSQQTKSGSYNDRNKPEYNRGYQQNKQEYDASNKSYQHGRNEYEKAYQHNKHEFDSSRQGYQHNKPDNDSRNYNSNKYEYGAQNSYDTQTNSNKFEYNQQNSNKYEYNQQNSNKYEYNQQNTTKSGYGQQNNNRQGYGQHNYQQNNTKTDKKPGYSQGNYNANTTNKNDYKSQNDSKNTAKPNEYNKQNKTAAYNVDYQQYSHQKGDYLQNKPARGDVKSSFAVNTDLAQQLSAVKIDDPKSVNTNADFAMRSFKRHLGLGNAGVNQVPVAKQHTGASDGAFSQGNVSEASVPQFLFKSGDQCLAKYWEDEKYYRATISETTDKTCVVQFNDYGNIEEVLISDCIPVTTEDQESLYLPNTSSSREFRRSKAQFKN